MALLSVYLIRCKNEGLKNCASNLLFSGFQMKMCYDTYGNNYMIK